MSSPGSPRSVHPLLAAAASALIPGIGQWLTGARRRALVLLGVDAMILAGTVVLFRDRVSLAVAFFRPSVLAVLMVGNIALLAYRVWAADDAYRLASQRRGPMPTGAGLAAVAILGILVLAPHVWFARIDLIQYDLLTSTFDETVASSEGTAEDEAESVGGDVAQAASPPTTAPAKTPWEDLDRLNILLLGGDFGVGRTGIRTDTMITLSLDPDTGDAALFQIPRNWTEVPLPEGMGIWDCACYPELINELWVAGERWPEAFPGSGTPSENAVKAIASEFLGIPIHYYALVNLDGFAELVDAIGGIDLYVPARIVDDVYPTLDGGSTRLVIEPGLQHMDGTEALSYARTRHQDSDYSRMFRQRCVIEAAMEQMGPGDLVRSFDRIAGVIKDNVTTDIPLELLPELVAVYPKIELDRVVSIRFLPPKYLHSYRYENFRGAIPDLRRVHGDVQLIINFPDLARVALGLDRRETCPDPPDEGDGASA